MRITTSDLLFTLRVMLRRRRVHQAPKSDDERALLVGALENAGRADIARSLTSLFDDDRNDELTLTSRDWIALVDSIELRVRV